MIRKLLLVGVMSASCSLMGMAEYCVSEKATPDKKGSVEFALLKALQTYSGSPNLTGVTISYPSALLGDFMRMKVPTHVQAGKGGFSLALCHSVGPSNPYAFVPSSELPETGKFTWQEILSLIAIGSSMNPAWIEVSSGIHDKLDALQATFDSVRNKLTIACQS